MNLYEALKVIKEIAERYERSMQAIRAAAEVERKRRKDAKREADRKAPG